MKAAEIIYKLHKENAMKFPKNMYYDKAHDCWMHRSALKRIINPILRKLQFWTGRPWVIASVCKMVNGIPVFIKYDLTRIEYLGPFKKENCITEK